VTLVEWVISLSRVLLETAGDPPPRQTIEVLAAAPLPLAVFRATTYSVMFASTPWRALFGIGDRPPRALHDPLVRADRSREPQTLPKLEVPHETDLGAAAPTYRFVIQPVALTDSSSALIAACSEPEDEDSEQAKQQHIALLDRLLVALNDAESANRAKDNFLATVSHELRAPVTTIMLWENVLRDHLDDTSLRLRALDAIRESAAAQARLVGDLLDISRAISGKLRLERRRLAIETVLTAAVDAALPSATAKSITIETAIRPRLGRVLADAARLRQVFDNLLSNAVKFTPAGGKITVDARRDRTAVVVTISDTGRGIDPDLLERLFTPFVRQEQALTRSEGGLGLGLAITKQLVDLHDGTLAASSAGAGKGSTFKVSLPLAQQRSTTPAPSSPEPVGRLEGVRVLVVDDEPHVREGLSLLLGRIGATVDAAGGAAEARELLARTHPDVLICDISMPAEDGYAFMRGLRASDSAARTIPAIALTAYASARDRERAAAAGFDAHLAKPVHLQGLVSTITQLLAARSEIA